MSGTATMPTVTNSTEVKSPRQLVWDYLAANNKLRGSGPTSADVRAALEANARNPGMIPGLDNQEPPGPDPAASATSASSGNRKSSNGPITDQSNTSSAPGETQRGSGDPNTSAPPPSGDANSDMMRALAATGLLGSGVGAAILGGRNLPTTGTPGMPTPGGSVPPPVDPGAGVPGAPPLELPTQPGRVMQGIAGNEVSPAAVGIDRATENAPVISGLKPPPDPSIPAGPTTPTVGAEPPMMPNATTRQAIRTEPGRAPLYIRPSVRPPVRVPRL